MPALVALWHRWLLWAWRSPTGPSGPPRDGCYACQGASRGLPASLLTFAALVRYNDRKEVITMTQREVGFIKAAARGLKLAREKLSGPDAEAEIAKALSAIADPAPGAISNHDIAFFAAMWLTWEDRGRPDLFT